MVELKMESIIQLTNNGLMKSKDNPGELTNKAFPITFRFERRYIFILKTKAASFTIMNSPDHKFNR